MDRGRDGIRGSPCATAGLKSVTGLRFNLSAPQPLAAATLAASTTNTGGALYRATLGRSCVQGRVVRDDRDTTGYGAMDIPCSRKGYAELAGMTPRCCCDPSLF